MIRSKIKSQKNRYMKISKYLTIIFTVVLGFIMLQIAALGFLAYGSIIFRMYTLQSNLAVLVIYILICLSYFIKPLQIFRTNNRIRFILLTFISITIMIVAFVLGPLQIAKAFGVGPGAFGFIPEPNFPTGIPEWVKKIIFIRKYEVNIMLHLIAPMFVILHYYQDKKYRVIEGNVSGIETLFTPIYLIYAFAPSTYLMYYYGDGITPYSILNPSMWPQGWVVVGSFMGVSALIYAISTKIELHIARKYEAVFFW